MTIKTFQELHYIATGADSDFDKSVKMVACLTGITPDKVDAMPMRKFNYYCRQIAKKFEVIGSKMQKGKPRSWVFVRGRFYRLQYDARKINAGKYVEALTFNSDVVQNLHKIMATIAVPVNWRGKVVERDHDLIAADMERLDFEVAYQCAVFFYLLYRTSIAVSLPYLVQQAAKQGASREMAEKALTDFISITDGFTMPNWSRISREYLSNRFGISV